MTTSAVAGTFDVLHEGHKALLRRAFEVGDRVLVGITSDRMASSGRDVSVPLEVRSAELRRFLDSLGRYELFVIDDIYGPADIMDGADVLVVSVETLANGKTLNDDRAARGVPPLELSVVPLVDADDGSKISASAILRGEYGRSGRRDVPDIAVGSLNPVKVEAVRNVMERIYGDVRITAVDVQGDVPQQPFGNETRLGAENRARNALGSHGMSVGIEAGVFEFPDGLYDIQHCAVVSRDGRVTYGQGSGFRYPDDIASLVRSGKTVEEAVRELYGGDGVGKRQGAVGMLSHGLLDRLGLTEQAVTTAMIPRIWEERSCSRGSRSARVRSTLQTSRR